MKYREARGEAPIWIQRLVFWGGAVTAAVTVQAVTADAEEVQRRGTHTCNPFYIRAYSFVCKLHKLYIQRWYFRFPNEVFVNDRTA